MTIYYNLAVWWVHVHKAGNSSFTGLEVQVVAEGRERGKREM